MRRYLIYLFLFAALSSCSGGEDNAVELLEGMPGIVVVAPIGGVGDVGYNDLVFDGIMEFATANDVVLSMVSPADMQEVRQAVADWCSRSVGGEKSLLVLASDDYEQLLDGDFPELEASQRVLLFESGRSELPGNVSTILVRRYGAAYLCGRMAAECPQAFVLAPRPDEAMLQPAIDGFRQGYADGGGRTAKVVYIVDDDSGFNSPEKAYALTKGLPWNAFVFPIAEGSNSGVYKYVRENMFSGMLVAGMDVDCSGYSTRIPFSLTLAIDRLLTGFLTDWLAGASLPQHQQGGLTEGFTSVEVNADFYKNILFWEDYYDSPDYWQNACEAHRQEALEAERRYYEK